MRAFFTPAAAAIFNDNLRCLLIEVPPIAAQADGRTLHLVPQGVEQRLDPVSEWHSACQRAGLQQVAKPPASVQ